MTPLHRFLVPAAAVDGDHAVLPADQARQIANVLRLAAGDHVVLVREGDEVEVRLDAVAARSVSGTVVGLRRSPTEPRVQVALALPLLRGDRSAEVIEAVTQLGVSRIVPFTSERSVARELSAAKRSRWERIARESAETAGRGRAPEIAGLVGWAGLFDVVEPPVVVAWEREGERTLPEALPSNTSRLSLVVGPEGGLSEEEIVLSRSRGAIVVSLGPRNLRSETAAIAAVAVVIAVLGS